MLEIANAMLVSNGPGLPRPPIEDPPPDPPEPGPVPPEPGTPPEPIDVF
jgi:hypothetical protein